MGTAALAPASPERRWERWAWGLLVVSSACYFLADNEADNDLWVHLLTGGDIIASGRIPRVDHLSYTVAGAAWFDHEWLTQSLLAGVFQIAGDRGLWALKCAVGLLAAWLLWRAVARTSEIAWVRGTVMLLALAVMARGFSPRPQIVSYLGAVWLLGRLDASARAPAGPGRQTGWIAQLALTFVAWGNMHGAFILGLAILAVHAAVPPWRDAGWRVAGILAALAAVCVNPYGPSLLVYTWNELRVPHPITEWQPVAFADPAQGPFLLLLAILVVTAPFATVLRRQAWRAVLVAGVAAMALRHQRHTPLLALCAAVPLADQLPGAAAWCRRHGVPGFSLPVRAVLAAGLAVLALAQTTMLTARLTADRFRIVYDAREYPVGAVDFMRRAGLGGNLALPLEWGGYVLWHGAPSLKVSLDGRFATLYPPEVVRTNFDFFSGLDDRLLTDYATTLVLAPIGAPVPVRNRPGWVVRYRDETAELFARDAQGPMTGGRTMTGRRPFP